MSNDRFKINTSETPEETDGGEVHPLDKSPPRPDTWCPSKDLVRARLKLKCSYAVIVILAGWIVYLLRK